MWLVSPFDRSWHGYMQEHNAVKWMHHQTDINRPHVEMAYETNPECVNDEENKRHHSPSVITKSPLLAPVVSRTSTGGPTCTTEVH
jgi:hypothetical protein